MVSPGESLIILEPVSKISSAPAGGMHAADSLNLAKQPAVYLSGYTSGFFARFPRLASYLVNLAMKLFLRPVLIECQRQTTVGARRSVPSKNYFGGNNLVLGQFKNKGPLLSSISVCQRIGKYD